MFELNVADNTPPPPPPSDANLLINGSFENPGYGAGTWNILREIEGWTAIDRGNMEVWNDILGVTPSDGDHVVELDALDDVDGFYQDVQTAEGQTYNLSLDARLRPGPPCRPANCSNPVEWRSHCPVHTGSRLVRAHFLCCGNRWRRPPDSTRTCQ